MKYFTWTPELESELCRLHHEGLTYKHIAAVLGCSHDSAKKMGSKYIKAGLLTKREQAPIPAEDLFELLKQYKTRDSAPSSVVYKIVKKFGSWEKGLLAASLPLNIGGTMDINKPTLLYLLKFNGFYKVGITQQTLRQRFAGAPLFLVLDTYEGPLDEMVELEQEILKKVTKYLPEDKWFERNGKTECFVSNKNIQSFEDLI